MPEDLAALRKVSVKLKEDGGLLQKADKAFVLEIINCRDYNYHTQQKDGICAARDHDPAMRQDLP